MKFWKDIPNSVLVEKCYIRDCNVMSSGGGYLDGVSVTLCDKHRNKYSLEQAIGELERWKAGS